MATKVSKEVMKDINEKLLLKEIYHRKGIDRATLAKKTGLSPATVTNIVGELTRKNLVAETGVADSTGGRKPILLSVNPRHSYVIGMKIGVGYVDFVVTDLLGSPLKTSRTLFDGTISPELVLNELAEFKSRLDDPAWGSLLGVGVAVSGVVDPGSGTVRNSYLLDWKDVPIGSMIASTLDTRVVVLNDVDSFAQAQMWKGNSWRYQNSIFVTLGVGVGGAVVIGGKLHSAKGGVGEFGHMTVRLDGQPCTCGSKGCLEAEASFMILARRIFDATSSNELKELYRSVRSTESSEIEYLERALTVDPDSTIRVFDDYATIIGVALKNLVNIFAPDYLLLGGEAMKFEHLFYDSAVAYARNNAFGGLADNVVFERDEIGENAWTFGCIYEIIQKELLMARSN